MQLIKRNIIFLLFLFSSSAWLLAQPSIYSVRQNGILAKAGIDGSNLTELNNDIGQGNGVALDIAGGKVYYSDGTGGTIKSANLDGTNEETIVADAGGPFGIDLDLKNNRLYWLSRNEGEVQYIDLTANPATVMTLATIGGNFPVTVLVDTLNNKLYWDHVGNGNNSGEIICYNLSNNTQNVILNGLRFPSGMALVGNQIYWADFGNGTINRTNIDGTNTITIESGLTSPIGLAVDIANNKIYVSEQGGAQDIYSSDINDLTNDRIQILDLTGTPEHIALALSYAEITITGQGNDIMDSPSCDIATSTNNDTDFGSLIINKEDDTHTFTIKNEGNFPLNLTNTSNLITIGGANAGDFTITQPSTNSIPPNGMTTFSVKFSPSALGLRKATVTIINNDCTEATFCFGIQGTGVNCPDLSSVTPAKAVIQNSSCNVFGGMPSGGSITAPTTTNCLTGSTLQYSKDNSTFSESIPTYNQTTSETIFTKCVCDNTNTTTSSVVSVSTNPMACPNCPDLSSITPANAVIQNSSCNMIDGMPANGSITAPTTTNCPAGSTLQYSKDNSTFSESIPTYNQTTSETIYTKCVCDNTTTTTSSVVSISTNPGACPNCPDLSSIIPAKAVIQNSSCNMVSGMSDDGNITAPTTTNCPNGSTLQYSKDNSIFSGVIPVYNQTTSETIYTKCVCDNTNTTVSSVESISTSPGSCGDLLQSNDFSITDPCSCQNPQNVTLADGRFLFQDVLKVMTTTGLSVTLTSTDNHLLDDTGVPILPNTPFIETSTGIYELTFYTLPNTPATIAVSNGISTQNFTTDSCNICPSKPIPTLNQWGLILYSLIILNLGLVFLRKKLQLQFR